jgi:orotidine-5'-phosphate decarboxylase
MDIATAKEKLIVALDVPTFTEAFNLATAIHQYVGMFKIGLELFTATGPDAIHNLRRWRPVMLDLKLHDIPETVARTVDVAGELGVKFLTLHVQQRETLHKAAAAANKHPGMTLLGVTVLTSMSSDDLVDLEEQIPSSFGGHITDRTRHYDIAERINSLAKLAYGCGIHGFVCSPKDARALRDTLPSHETMVMPKPIIVTPGITPGTETRDHKRSASPADAIKAGSDYLVVGRPIRDAPHPAEAARRIVEEIAHAHLPA